jgi:HSP20 family molecular chaperone IbpA
MNRPKEIAKKEPQSLRALAGFASASPSIDVFENADEILLMADMPGVASESLNVNVDKGELLVEAARDVALQGTLIEAEYGPCLYQRRFVLPAGIDVSRVSADLKDGVLRLHLPKSEAFKPRRIEVQGG